MDDENTDGMTRAERRESRFEQAVLMTVGAIVVAFILIWVLDVNSTPIQRIVFIAGATVSLGLLAFGFFGPIIIGAAD